VRKIKELKVNPLPQKGRGQKTSPPRLEGGEEPTHQLKNFKIIKRDKDEGGSGNFVQPRKRSGNEEGES